FRELGDDLPACSGRSPLHGPGGKGRAGHQGHQRPTSQMARTISISSAEGFGPATTRYIGARTDRSTRNALRLLLARICKVSAHTQEGDAAGMLANASGPVSLSPMAYATWRASANSPAGNCSAPAANTLERYRSSPLARAARRASIRTHCR